MYQNETIFKQMLRQILLILFFATSTSHAIERVVPNIPLGEKSLGKTDSVRIDTSAIEEKIAAEFAEGGCLYIKNRGELSHYRYYKAVTLAIVAYCEKNESLGQELFSMTEHKKDGDSVVVLLLEARYLWKIQHEKSVEIWKVLLNKAPEDIRELARAYLNAAEGEQVEKQEERGWFRNQYFLTTNLGTSYETNPLQQGNYENTNNPRPSGATNLLVSAEALRNYSSGSVALDYNFSKSTYFSTSTAELTVHNFQLPVMYKLHAWGEVKVMPFWGTFTWGSNPYMNQLGGALIYEQAFNFARTLTKISFYQDRYHLTSFESQQGNHQRLDELWEIDWWWLPFVVNGGGYYERFDGGADDLPSANLYLPYSAEIYSGYLTAEYNLNSKWKLDFIPRLTIRQDRDSSRFVQQSGGSPISKYRQDFLWEGQLIISYLHSNTYHVHATYHYLQNNSSINANDYTDRNYKNQQFKVDLQVMAF